MASRSVGLTRFLTRVPPTSLWKRHLRNINPEKELDWGGTRPKWARQGNPSRINTRREAEKGKQKLTWMACACHNRTRIVYAPSKHLPYRPNTWAHSRVRRYSSGRTPTANFIDGQRTLTSHGRLCGKLTEKYPFRSGDLIFADGLFRQINDRPEVHGDRKKEGCAVSDVLTETRRGPLSR